MPTKQVMLGNQILHGSTREGEWVTEKITNWYEPPASRGNEEERPLGDGDYDAEMFYSKRLPTIDGILFHKGRGYAIQALERLAAAASLNAQALTVTDFGLTRFANVKSLGLDYTAVTTRAIRWQIRLKANDPYKYGEERVATGSASVPAPVFQRGTAPAWPVVTLSGTASSSSGQPYTLTLNGRSVTVTVGRFAADPAHTIDFRTGILRVGGVVVVGGIGAADFSPINPGLPQAISSTIGGVTVRWSDTYI